MARPIVLLPGLLRPASDWDEVARSLPPGLDARVFPIDGPPWRPDEAAPAIEARLRREAPEGAHLVGHSRGAAIAGWVAVNAPDLVASLAVVCSPPEPSEAFRAYFRDRVDPRSPHKAAFEAMARMPDEAFPGIALRRYQKPALVIEAADDPLYSPTHTMFWRMFLPYAAFERVESAAFDRPNRSEFGRVEGADHASILRGEHARWLADRLARHIEEAEQRGS